MASDQEDLFDGPGDQTDDGRPSGMRQQQPKPRKGADPLADLVDRANEQRRTDVCEGAVMFRRRLVDRLAGWIRDDDPTIQGVLAAMVDVDGSFRKQFGDEYQRQLDMRKND